MWPFIVSTARGQYLDAFEQVRPGHVSKFPLFISLSHVDLIEYPDAACMYLHSASTLGRSYALYNELVFILLSWFSRGSLLGHTAKRHRFGISFSLHHARMGLHLGENTVI